MTSGSNQYYINCSWEATYLGSYMRGLGVLTLLPARCSLRLLFFRRSWHTERRRDHTACAAELAEYWNPRAGSCISSAATGVLKADVY